MSGAYKIVSGIRIVVGGLAAFVGLCLKADALTWARKIGEPVGDGIAFVQATAWMSVPALLLLVTILGRLRRSIGDPRIWRIVHGVLDDFRAHVFEHAQAADLHEHRVTLFQYKRFAFCWRVWPWSGWLVPVERSGHTTRRTKTIFQAVDNPDHATDRGVAGAAWSRRSITSVDMLPDLATNPSDADFAEYASKSWVSEEYLRKHLPRARSIYAIPVEVGGTQWGVIVIDSRHPKLAGDGKLVKRHHRMVARFLGMTLEGV